MFRSDCVALYTAGITNHIVCLMLSQVTKMQYSGTPLVRPSLCIRKVASR